MQCLPVLFDAELDVQPKPLDDVVAKILFPVFGDEVVDDQF